ncbi:MAG: glycosyltransferase [Anaerocolumna aminovalerica]|uniref:glycosyltransferase n=1 Tax=Anaerocolumna aminovalerica TaxID=1527 RepID=UPI002910C9AC|nr:glycosyltransferase [Anaerocolumna aminovalerica]MDU6265989.1 glycosyltransferase [Anaerocolumna aminovalerica]
MFDNINYISGAQKVTEYQIKLLSDSYDISVFSLIRPNNDVKERLPMVNFIGDAIWNKTEILGLSFYEVIHSNKYSIKQKLLRIQYALLMRLNNKHDYMDKYIGELKEEFNTYDIVCVVSEASKLRALVGSLSYPKKIQWIHTDYARWSEFSEWTRKVTENDEEIYKNYDTIVTLSETSRKGFIHKIPSLENKTVIISNLIQIDLIKKKSHEPLEINLNHKLTNIVTVGRLDKEKSYDRIFDLCKYMKNEHVQFHWYIVGDGPMRKHLQQRLENEGLRKEISLLGFMDNPYPLIKEADLFALLSEYEGTPVTIVEALILGTPVIATDVGGIAEQLEYGKWGILLNNNDKEISTKICRVLFSKAWKTDEKENLKNYSYNNANILKKTKDIF